MARIYLGVGSNVESERHIRSCIAALRKTFGALIVSPIYRNPAVGFEGEDFLNLVIGFDTDESVRAVAKRLREIEVAHGRRRDAPKFSPRTLDLDLLLYDDLILEAGGLQVPRDDITRYAYVLRPLADIAGQRRHPISGQTFGQLWEAFEHNGEGLQRIPLSLESSQA